MPEEFSSNETRSQVCTAHYAGVAGGILQWRCGGRQQRLFLLEWLSHLSQWRKLSQHKQFFCWLSCLQSKSLSSAAMTGSNPFTLTGLWAAVLFHYEAFCEGVEVVKSFVHKLVFWIQFKTVFIEQAKLKPTGHFYL